MKRPTEPTDNQQERYRTGQNRLEIGQNRSESQNLGEGGFTEGVKRPNHMVCIVYTHGISKALHSKDITIYSKDIIYKNKKSK